MKTIANRCPGKLNALFLWFLPDIRSFSFYFRGKDSFELPSMTKANYITKSEHIRAKSEQEQFIQRRYGVVTLATGDHNAQTSTAPSVIQQRCGYNS
jgi:hypothetical protein